MAVIDDEADALARESLAVAQQTGDAELVCQVSDLLATSSTVTQEAFMAAIRVHQAVARARKFLADKQAAAGVVDPAEPT